MENIINIKNAIEYLEDNITEKIIIEEAAKIAYCSSFHFQRMFHMIMGVTVTDYIRRRRLTLAAQELQNSKVKVIDLAYKYGYETPEAFTKAFKRLHGISPLSARKAGTSLKAYPKLTLHISIKGDKDMDYKIINKESFKVIGKEIKVSMEDGKNFDIVPQFWQSCIADGSYEKICSMAGNMGVLGICKDFNEQYNSFTYMIAVEKQGGQTLEGFSETEIPNAKWATFQSIGPMPKAIQEVWQRIFSEWFPATDYQQDEKPQMEVYPVGDITSENYKCEVWIPIK